MLKFSEIFEFSKEKFRKIPILKEFEWFEWFEWFGPSPIEPFNSGYRYGALLRHALPELPPSATLCEAFWNSAGGGGDPALPRNSV